MSKGLLSGSGTYSLTYNLTYRFYKFMKAHPMGEISARATTRLAMIEFYYQVQDATVVANSFKTSRKNFYKWFKRYEESGGKLSSLEDQSRAPHIRHDVELSFKEEMEIKHVREKHIRLSNANTRLLMPVYTKTSRRFSPLIFS